MFKGSTMAHLINQNSDRLFSSQLLEPTNRLVSGGPKTTPKPFLGSQARAKTDFEESVGELAIKLASPLLTDFMNGTKPFINTESSNGFPAKPRNPFMLDYLTRPLSSRLSRKDSPRKPCFETYFSHQGRNIVVPPPSTIELTKKLKSCVKVCVTDSDSDQGSSSGHGSFSSQNTIKLLNEKNHGETRIASDGATSGHRTRQYRSRCKEYSSSGSSSSGGRSRSRVKYTECVFCKTNGETATMYRSHVLKDERGRTACHVLQKYICPLCGATGINAHTVKYCPKNANPPPVATMTTLKSMRSSTGRKRQALLLK